MEQRYKGILNGGFRAGGTQQGNSVRPWSWCWDCSSSGKTQNEEEKMNGECNCMKSYLQNSGYRLKEKGSLFLFLVVNF